MTTERRKYFFFLRNSLANSTDCALSTVASLQGVQVTATNCVLFADYSCLFKFRN